jgi:phosphoenolpyruvate-protein kinase (PTS system EI component)
MHPTSELISPDTRRPAALHGIAASPGIARGPAFLCPCGQRLAVPRYAVGENELPDELEKLEAATALRIAREADFLSVGTNDLVQYLLISDRASPTMTAYYEPLHPAVLHVLKSVIETANAEAKGLSICGEMAGNPSYVQLLVGLGARSLSVSPGEILEIKKTIRSLRVEVAESVAKHALELGTAQEIKDLIVHP